jgi:hypothetical protein
MNERGTTMKRKCLIIVLIVTAVIFLTFVPVKSHAAVPMGFSDANIDYAGPLFGKIIIKVTAENGSYTNQWLELYFERPLISIPSNSLSLWEWVGIRV